VEAAAFDETLMLSGPSESGHWIAKMLRRDHVNVHSALYPTLVRRLW
jgi:hypothetical protein